MANEEHIEMLKPGVDAWNKWRADNPNLVPDLSSAQLSGANLSALSLAAFSRYYIPRSYNLRDVDFEFATLHGATFRLADLSGASFDSADLSDAYFDTVDLDGANLAGANLGGTRFIETDLSKVIGLDLVNHYDRSSIDIDTLFLSKGDIPEEFLRGCGVPESLIVYARSLVVQAIEFYSCFISYSSADQEFATRLHGDLQKRGVRCWFAPRDLRIGERFRQRIEECIHLQDRLLLILSERSISSSWVEDEVEAAMERERKEERVVLFPIRIDDAVMQTNRGWAASIKRKYHIGDFSAATNAITYENAFDRLVEASERDNL